MPKPKNNLNSMALVHVGDALKSSDPVDALQRYLVPKLVQLPVNDRLEALSEPSRVLFLVDQFRREMLNGGFFGFLSNGSGMYSRETAVALHEVNALRCYELLKDVLSCFSRDLSPNQMERAKAMSAVEGALEKRCRENDKAFDASVKAHPEQTAEVENLWYLSLEYLKKHAECRIFSDSEALP